MAQESNQVMRDLTPETRRDASESPSPATAEIRQHSEDTRAEMSQTIDAIQARLSPGRFVSNAKESVKNGASANARRAVDAVKAHPMPFAMVGAAAIALIARAATRGQRFNRMRGQDSHRRSERTSERRRRLFAGLCGAGVAGLSAWRASGARKNAVGRPRLHF